MRMLPHLLGLMLCLAASSPIWAAPWATGGSMDDSSHATRGSQSIVAMSTDGRMRVPFRLDGFGLLGAAGVVPHANATTTYSYLAESGPRLPEPAQPHEMVHGHSVAETGRAPSVDVSYTLADGRSCTGSIVCPVPNDALLLASAGGIAGLLGWIHFRRHQPDLPPPV